MYVGDSIRPYMIHNSKGQLMGLSVDYLSDCAYILTKIGM